MSKPFRDKKLAVLGAGKLGGILLRAYLKQGLFTAKQVTATVKHGEKTAPRAKTLGVSVISDNRKAVKGADVILLSVKPQAVAEVLGEIAPEIGPKALLISVAASVPTSYLEQQLALAIAKPRKIAVARAKPISRLRGPCSTPSVAPSCWMKNTWTRSPAYRRVARPLPTSFWNRWLKPA